MSICDRIAVTLFSFMVIVVLFSLGQHVSFDGHEASRLALLADAGGIHSGSVVVKNDVFPLDVSRLLNFD